MAKRRRNQDEEGGSSFDVDSGTDVGQALNIRVSQAKQKRLKAKTNQPPSKITAAARETGTKKNGKRSLEPDAPVSLPSKSRKKRSGQSDAAKADTEHAAKHDADNQAEQQPDQPQRKSRSARRAYRKRQEAKLRKQNSETARKADAASPVSSAWGGDEGHLRRSEMIMVSTQAQRRVPTDRNVLQALLTRTARTGLESKDPRVILRATQTYLMAEVVNQRDELSREPQQVEHEHRVVRDDEKRNRILALFNRKLDRLEVTERDIDPAERARRDAQRQPGTGSVTRDNASRSGSNGARTDESL